MNTETPGPIPGLSEIAGLYDAVLCDVWGVVHNGVARFPAACEALARFRAEGGTVVLITNAPRPHGPILAQLDGFGVDRAAYDAVVTSGDVTRDILAAQGARPVFHLGPERDLTLYEGLPLRLVAAEEAEVISCTGLFDDDVETVADYADRLAEYAARGMTMVCANPDLVVERGDRLIPCAGALAELFGALGGETLIAGKPHPPIYAAALDRLEAIAGRRVPKERVLAIGDGVGTDVRGAYRQALDVLFVAGGIHAAEFGSPDLPERDAVWRFLTRHEVGARAYLPRLTW